jgi:hypothetical protein
MFCRWTGSAPEPRPNLSSGHIPNSLSLPFNALLAPSNPDRPYTSYLPPSSLRETILSSLTFPGETPKDAQVRWENIKRGKKGVIWSCGSGMTACVGVWGMRVLASAEERDEGMRAGIYDEVRVGMRNSRSRLQFRIDLVVRELIYLLFFLERAGRVTHRGRRARSSKAKNRSSGLPYRRIVKAIVCPRTGTKYLGSLCPSLIEHRRCLSSVEEGVV